MLDQLNTYSPLISAVAALISAGALLVVAWMNRGTWKLYELEKEKAELVESTMGTEMVRIAACCRTAVIGLGAFLEIPADERTDQEYALTVWPAVQTAKRLREMLPETIKNAWETSEKALGYLQFSHLMINAVCAWGEALPESYTSECDDQLLKIYSELRQVSKMIEQGSGISEGFLSRDEDFEKDEKELAELPLAERLERHRSSRAWMLPGVG